jgi:hypothetical protein
MTLDPRLCLRAAARSLAALSVVFCLGVGEARALRIQQLPGSSGHAWPNADENCFEHSWTVMTNQCSAKKKLIFTPAVEGGEMVIHVWVRGDGGANSVSCQALAQHRMAHSVKFTPVRQTIGFLPTWQNLALIGLTMNSNEALQIECSVSPGMSVSQVDIGEI